MSKQRRKGRRHSPDREEHERLEIRAYMAHIQKYELFAGVTAHIDLYVCYVADFSEYYPDIYSGMSPRSFSLGLKEFGLKRTRRALGCVRRSTTGEKIGPGSVSHFDVPKAGSVPQPGDGNVVQIPVEKSIRIAA